ncbi:hypothetical protein [Micromonospora sp. KC213]|uniref:hypothetical protein n=1 Tax=Micromonospora sp. KC213 TaxID=2530378 RepID=UPI001048EF84|nr:hypothetical protein [Micromonospora sp. KC213]TDC43102.1 hypothetical protein E1166_05335 [Micromonospora sp. KC213]
MSGGPQDGPQVVAGDVLLLGREASPQFVRPLTVRVIRRLDDWHTYDGWLWLDGYEVGTKGVATRRRTLYVRLAGFRWLSMSARPTRPRRPPARTVVAG